jgi:endonuclease YncB( thermonuclease family)
MRRLVLCGLIALVASLTSAAPGAWAAGRERSFEGYVTHVSDGDTFRVRPLQGGPSRPIRILGIDAPESCQAYGAEARDALQSRVARERVHIDATGEDEYGRTLAKVEVRGEDLGAMLVREGHAWSYRFKRDPGPYLREEKLARLTHRGLWRDPHPVQPRTFRKEHGPCDEHPRR